MKKLAVLYGAVAVLLCAGASSAYASAPEYDIVIRNGRVLDGAGNPWVHADVAVKDDRVVSVGQVTGSGAREVDATGRYVSPLPRTSCVRASRP